MNTDLLFKGTTTVGLVCKGGVVLAAEKRATMGHFIASKIAKKIYQISDRIGMTTAGLVGDTQMLVRILSAESNLYKMRRQEPMSVKATVTLLSNILSGQRYFPFLVQLIVGGVDKTGPSLYSLDALGGQIEEREIVATGSGSTIAYGVLEDNYVKDLEPEDGINLAVRALHNAMKRDSASGNDIDVVLITYDKYHQLSEEEVRKRREKLT